MCVAALDHVCVQHLYQVSYTHIYTDLVIHQAKPLIMKYSMAWILILSHIGLHFLIFQKLSLLIKPIYWSSAIYTGFFGGLQLNTAMDYSVTHH